MGRKITDLEAHNRALKLKETLFPVAEPTPGTLAKAVKIQVAAEMAKVHKDAAKF